MRSILVFMAFALVAMATQPLLADDLFDRYFAKAVHGQPCYAHSYGAAHLKRHPKQKTVHVALGYPNAWCDYKHPESAPKISAYLLRNSRFAESQNGEWFDVH